MEITYYLQYLLIKKWIYNNKDVWGRGDNKTSGGNEAKIPEVNSANPLYKKYRFSNFSLHPVLYIDIDTDNDDLLIQ